MTYGTRRRLVHYYGRNRGSAVAGTTRTYTPKPPRGAPGSSEAILYSGNILYDPGFELFVQNAGPSYLKNPWYNHTGATSYVLPRFDITRPRGQRWPNGDSVTYYDIAQWAQYTEPYEIADDIREASVWNVVRREAPDLDFTTIRGPKLGIWMARWYDWQCSGRYTGGNAIPGGLVIQGPGMPPGYSGRTEAGALIGWGAHVWVTEITGAPIMDLSLTFYQQNGTPVFTTTSAHTLTTTKSEYILSSNSPGGSYFMRAAMTFRGVGAPATMLQVDTGILSVE